MQICSLVQQCYISCHKTYLLWGLPGFSSGVCAADWILGWKKTVYFEFNELMEGQATSLLSCTNASGEHTVHWFHLDSHRILLDLQDKFRSLRWNTHPFSWKQSGKIVIQTSVIFVACTNKHVQPLRIEMKPPWSRLKGFEDVEHSIPWKHSAWSRREGGMARERAMSSARL